MSVESGVGKDFQMGPGKDVRCLAMNSMIYVDVTASGWCISTGRGTMPKSDPHKARVNVCSYL